MKTKRQNIQRLSVLTVTVLALSFASIGEATAGVRVKATVRTPYGAVRIGNDHGHRYEGRRHGYEFRITKRDKKIARRLARYTGESKREILRMRRHGYRWNEIGRWLGVSRRVVRAAKHKHSWQRFMDAEYRYERCGNDRYGPVTRYKVR